MTQAVELLLDPEAEAAVVADWRRLAVAGFASQARHRSESNRPHVTVAAVASLPEDEEPVARRVVDRLPVEVRLGALVVFGAAPRITLARLVVATPALLALHGAISELIDHADSPTAPARWTPHVTLALRMPVEQLVPALAVLASVADGPVLLDRARRWDGEARRSWALG